MKKFLIILAIFVVIVGTGIFIAFSYYKNSLKPVGSEDEKVDLIIDEGLTSKQIIEKLYEADLIKNKYTGYIYLKLNKDINLQAGSYPLNRGMSLEEILKKISNGEAYHESKTIQFVEGKKLTYFADKIAENYSYESSEVMDTLQNKEYLKELINKYWFLTEDILNDKLYYALEGYLFPETYQFEVDATIKQIIEKILDHTGTILAKYKTDIENSKYSIHQILTMASIVELEGSTSNDRAGVAGVFYNRLENGWSLGSDVTTYYAAKVEMSERDLYQAELDDVNAYNTRSSSMAGKLPVGPICNPGEGSIKAAINPTDHDYFYFVADKNKKTYFSKDYGEHQNTINKLKNNGLWYVYK